MVKPAGKKRIATHLIEQFKLSGRSACRLAGISRTVFRYVHKQKADGVVRARLKTLATQYSHYGYLMLHGLLKSEG